MKRYISFIITLLTVIPTATWALGIPLLKNYMSEEYQAHNINFDIYTGKNGIVYAANFEGLLYYDKAEWHIIHTPGITRVTSLYCDKQERIWAGGYNFLGYLKTNEQGILYLHAINIGGLRGEISQLHETNGQLTFRLSNGKSYQVNGETIVEINSLDVNSNNQQLILDDGLIVNITEGNGLLIEDKFGKTICHYTEDNGLCSNIINNVCYDGNGTLWGATNKGIFALAIPSKYAHYTSTEGLKGEISDIEELDSVIFVSTTNGVYRDNGFSFTPVEGINLGCLQLYQTGNTLLAATSMGVFSIPKYGAARLLSKESAISVLGTPDRFYCGELNCVMLYTNGYGTKIADIEKATEIYLDKDDCLWIKDIYGQVWSKAKNATSFKLVSDKQTVATMVIKDGKVDIITSADANDYPLFTITDKQGNTWMTNYEGRHLYAMKDNKHVEAFVEEIAPFSNYVIKALHHQKNFLWIGGEFGLITIGEDFTDASINSKPQLLIRSVTLNADSVIWGGFGTQPEELPTFDSDSRNLTISYALAYPALAGETYYRYRINDGVWSAWSTSTIATFTNLAYGEYTFEVQAKDAFNRNTEIRKLEFSISYPFYMRWYMFLFYALILAMVVYLVVMWRMRQVIKEKIRLEKIVQERTAEVVKQKDEIEEKSKSLQAALDELAQTQQELIRQEKMATAGKLTQGLIDRILNPLNYINNFTKLSEGLAKDIKANIEDEKENISPDNYEDTMDVLDMLIGNLKKVGEHGQNNTRILKAMEEMLKERRGGIKPMNLLSVLHQDDEMMKKYFEEKIQQYGIKISFNLPQEEVSINGNPEQLSMTMMSLLGNSIYAVAKKAQREKYAPEISVDVTNSNDHYNIVIRDNGIGIEPTIINKIFDPFFTTKPTGEAAGVGLYISREIIQNHGGDISVKSEKDVYTEFTITLPILQN